MRGTTLLVYALQEILEERELDDVVENRIQAVILVNGSECADVLKKLGVVYDGEVSLEKIRFCKMETQQEYLYGTLSIPKLLDISGSRYKIALFITRYYIVIVDDSNFSRRLTNHIRTRKIHQGENKGRFLFNYVTEFIERDYETLDNMERKLMRMEEQVGHGSDENYQEKLGPVRRELLILRSYYNELVDFAEKLAENENGYFTKKQVRYFDTAEARMDRLMNKTMQLLDYAGQVKDAYQSNADAKQNRSMQMLTIISTIFLPLTLITSWYGMNFQNMPELKNGYPMVICLAIGVIVFCIWWFKKKGML